VAVVRRQVFYRLPSAPVKTTRTYHVTLATGIAPSEEAVLHAAY